MIGAYEITLLTGVGIAVIAALGLNLITGFCGQISLGHAAFYGIGAYTAALLAKGGFGFFPALVAGTLLAGLIGAAVGIASLRVRHDFLAITTMGVGFLFIGIVRQQDGLGGELGVSAIPDPGLGKTGFMMLCLGLAVAAALFSQALKRSWLGFAFDAIADDEDTARVLGIEVSHYKLAAFAMGTALAGLAGGLYAHQVRFIWPDSFAFVESIAMLTMVVIGGVGSVVGVSVAAAVLTLLPQWFQPVADYKLLVYGALLVLAMRFLPEGLAGLGRQLRSRKAATS
jgi:branched-chain amino acid transport system permease protein